MNDSKSYKLFESDEKEYYLKPCTFGLYEKVKLNQLNCTAIPESVKASIKKEFNLQDENSKDKFGVKELYGFIVRNIFLDAPKDFNINDLSISELNRANLDFFRSASGI